MENTNISSTASQSSENSSSVATTTSNKVGLMSGFEDEAVSFVSENEGENNAPAVGVADQQKIDGSKIQDPKLDSAFAKIRKEKEAYEKSMKEYDTWVEKNFGKEFGIKTFKEYQEMMDKQLRESKEAELRELGYDPDVIRDIIKNDPELSKALKTDDNKISQEQQMADDEKLVSDYKALASEYPDLVTKPEDIQPEVWELNNKGLDLVSAYTIVNRKAIVDKAKEAGKQLALNNINSKQHLKTEGDGQGETNDIQMPSDTLQMYLDMGMSRKQAFAHYKKLYGN